MSELGRYPFYQEIVKAMFKYWYRLENLDESSLLHGALECSKAIDGCNNSWYKSLRKISELLKIPLESSANMKLTTFTKKITMVLKQKYLEEWYSLREKIFHLETRLIHENKV